MARSLIERRLSRNADRLRRLRDEADQLDAQSHHMAALADDARLRALVSETPVADHEHRDAQRHAEAVGRRLAEVREEIAELERRQDELLDQLIAR